MDDIDRRLVNDLQQGIQPCARPFIAVAERLAISEDELLARLSALLRDQTLSRFGPMYNADRFGGSFTLAAMCVAPHDFDRVAALVNAFPEVAHNYRRDHEFNMWFVVAAEHRGRIVEVLREIEQRTGCAVLDLPKIEEYFIGLHLEAK